MDFAYRRFEPAMVERWAR